MRFSAQFIHKFVIGFLSVSLVAVVIVFTLLGVRTWREYQTFQEREQALKSLIVRSQEERADKQAYLQKMLSDPAFFERVTREQLGYSRDGELIIHFEE